VLAAGGCIAIALAFMFCVRTDSSTGREPSANIRADRPEPAVELASSQLTIQHGSLRDLIREAQFQEQLDAALAAAKKPDARPMEAPPSVESAASVPPDLAERASQPGALRDLIQEAQFREQLDAALEAAKKPQ
jgi:hypothetical protein